MKFPDAIHDFNARLDRAVPPYTKAIGDDDPDPLLDAARRLAQGPDVRLSPAARSRIEARVRQRQAMLHRPVHRRPARRGWIPTLRYAAAALLVIVLSLAGLTTASAHSLPGDRLYPVKRAVEDVRLTFASADHEARLRVDFAARRIDEFEALLKQNELYPLALEEASAQLNQTLDLLSGGSGNRAALTPRIVALTQRQTQLLQQTLPLVKYVNQFERLQAIGLENERIQQRLAAEEPVPMFTPDATATVIPAFTLIPTQTPTPTPTRTATPTPTVTPTPIPTRTPDPEVTAAPTVQPLLAASPTGEARKPEPDDPTRTPPGHGPTPGLGGDPPGQGGDNPGVGNDGSPPGQDKDKNEDKEKNK